MISAAWIAVVVVLGGPVPFLEPRRADQDDFLTRAVFADGRLWMRSDAGVLFSVAPGQVTVDEQRLGGAVLDLCVAGKDLYAVTWGWRQWTVLKHGASGWTTEARVAKGSDAFVGLGCSAEALAVVEEDQMTLLPFGAPPRKVRLSTRIDGGFSTALLMADGWLFVGANRGEFGGGLVRVRIADGRVARIAERGGGTCAGLVDEECHPIHGLAPVPWKPGCIAAAIGLVHMFMSEGRLVEVCGDQMRELLRVPLSNEPQGPAVAFFGLTAMGGSLVAVAGEGVYRVREREVRREALPTFREVGAFRVSIGRPGGLALVMTSVNARKSVSGKVPMLAVRPAVR